MSVRTAHLVLREWFDPQRSLEAARRDPDAPEMPGAAEFLPKEPQERSGEHHFAAPDRVREDRDGFLTIRRGGRWWIRYPDGTVESSDDQPGTQTTAGTMVLALLDPAAVLAQVRTEETGVGERAGRSVVHQRAVARPDADAVQMSVLGSYAEAWELELDTVTGALLASRALLDGSPFSVLEATVAEFDVPLDDGLFAPP